MENSYVTDFLENMNQNKEVMPLRGITIEEAIQKLKGVVPNISLKKICSFIAQEKLKPLIRYDGILVEYYFYTWHLQAALSGNYSHDDIDDFSPLTVGVTSKIFEGFLTPQNKDLFAKLLTQKKPEECSKFNIFRREKLLLNVDEEGLSNEMQLLSTIDGVAKLSHVQLKGNTVYGYIDDDGSVELEFSDFVFLERDVDSLCSEIKQNQNSFEPNENTLALKQPTLEKPTVLRMDATSEVLVNLIKENPNITKSEAWDRIKTMAANEEYPFKDTYHSDTVSFMVGSQSKLALDDDYKNISKRSVERRFASLKEKLSGKNPDKVE